MQATVCWPGRAALWLDSTVRCLLARGFAFDAMCWDADAADASWIGAIGRMDLCAELVARDMLNTGVRVDPFAGVTDLGRWMTIPSDPRWETSECALALHASSLLALLPAQTVDLLVLAPDPALSVSEVATLVAVARPAMKSSGCLVLVRGLEDELYAHLTAEWTLTEEVPIGAEDQPLVLLFCAPRAVTRRTVAPGLAPVRQPIRV
jgi:hypothetical protein